MRKYIENNITLCLNSGCKSNQKKYIGVGCESDEPLFFLICKDCTLKKVLVRIGETGFWQLLIKINSVQIFSAHQHEKIKEYEIEILLSSGDSLSVEMIPQVNNCEPCFKKVTITFG